MVAAQTQFFTSKGRFVKAQHLFNTELRIDISKLEALVTQRLTKNIMESQIAQTRQNILTL